MSESELPTYGCSPANVKRIGVAGIYRINRIRNHILLIFLITGIGVLTSCSEKTEYIYRETWEDMLRQQSNSSGEEPSSSDAEQSSSSEEYGSSGEEPSSSDVEQSSSSEEYSSSSLSNVSSSSSRSMCGELPAGRGCCGNGQIYDLMQQMCCSGNVQSIGVIQNPTCCGSIIRDVSWGYFCTDEGNVIQKCGGSEYDPKTHTCCGSTVCLRSSSSNSMPSSSSVKSSSNVALSSSSLPVVPCTSYSSASEFCDTRVGKIYKWVNINQQDWMAENLDYETDGSMYYNDNSTTFAKYGRLYQWEAATTACPPGWKLPTSDEWDILMNNTGGETQAGKNLKIDNTDYWPTVENKNNDPYKFAALSGGYCLPCNNVNYIGHWWTATRYGDKMAKRRFIYDTQTTLYSDEANMTIYHSVRCLKK